MVKQETKTEKNVFDEATKLYDEAARKSEIALTQEAITQINAEKSIFEAQKADAIKEIAKLDEKLANIKKHGVNGQW